MPQTRKPSPEFSRPVRLERLGRKSIVEEISATARERAALARRFGLLELDRFDATLRIGAADSRGLIRVTGQLSAEATQACVITLEPVASQVEEEFHLFYSLDADPVAVEAREIVIEPEGEEPPEPLDPAGLDLGEVAAQQLSLALDPYPRVPGATHAPKIEEGRGSETAAEGPFAVLGGLKREE